ncbi:MAG: methyltransferase type 11, partial [Phycisphaerae bacterium]|nr:methyltransferase type 11 [Phycisphaerae bacterium]
PVSIDKIEYDWTTEFHNPPRWLGTPLPWDWLFVARKQ